MFWGAQGSQPESLQSNAEVTNPWKSSVLHAIRGKISTGSGGGSQGRGQGHQRASAFVFHEVSLLPPTPPRVLILLGFALGKLPGKLEWAWFVLVWITKGKMCSAGQEVTHQDPCSRARAGPSTQRKKHETGVLEQEGEEKKKSNAMAGLGVGGKTGAADSARRTGPSRSISITLSIPKFSFTPADGKDPSYSSTWRGDTGEPRAQEQEISALGMLGHISGIFWHMLVQEPGGCLHCLGALGKATALPGH